MIAPDLDPYRLHQWPSDVNAFWRSAWVSDEPMIACFYRAQNLWPERAIVKDAIAVLHQMTTIIGEQIVEATR